MLVDFFMLNEIPAGPLLLRDLGLDRSKFIKEKGHGHKQEKALRLLDAYPELPFILIGDSGKKTRPSTPETSSYIISGMTDPTIGLQRLYWSKNITKGAPYSNGSGYSNPKVDELLIGAQFSADPAERVKFWREFQHITMRELPIIPIMNVNYVTVVNKRVKGIAATGFGVYANFAELYIGAP